MKIKEIMTVDVESLDPEDSLEEAARLFTDADIGCAPVVSNGMVLGVLTDRDIVVRAAAEGRDMTATKVRDVLTPGAVHCGEDDDVEAAAALMGEHQVRRIFVLTRDNELAGVLSLADIAPRTIEAARVLAAVSRATTRRMEPLPVAEPSEAETSLRGAGVSETGDAPRPRRTPVGSLLQDELSAVETYKRALSQVLGEKVAGELRRIEHEHEEAAGLLVESLRRRGEAAPKSSGLRGAWSRAVESAAAMFGSKAAIKALKRNEERDIHDYEDALRAGTLDPEAKELIRSRLLPRTRDHIPALDRILAAVG
jgi:CBS domain-containing protein